jgi:hypothetical protein
MSLDISLETPKFCPHCGGTLHCEAEIFTANITHNLIPMWRKSGVFDALYESDGKRAGDYVETLRVGIADFEKNYAEYEELNSPNGWGLAKNALPWLKKVLFAFEANRDANIRVSR